MQADLRNAGEAADEDSSARALNEAHSALNNLERYLCQALPHRFRKKARSIYRRTSAADTSLRLFATLLCDMETPAWSTASDLVHNTRQMLSMIGAGFQLSQMPDRERHQRIAHIERLSGAAELLDRQMSSWTRRFEGASITLISAYYGTAFHDAAEALMKERCASLVQQGVIPAAPEDTAGKPMVGRYLSFLSMFMSLEQIEKVLLKPPP
jgi:hypothetical protein